MKRPDRNPTSTGLDAGIQQTGGCVRRERGDALAGGLVFPTLFWGSGSCSRRVTSMLAC